MRNFWDEAGGTIITILLGVFIISGAIWGIGAVIGWWQTFKVYAAEQEGRAELQKAEFTRQISLLDAQAAINKSKGDAQAEIERARGAAEANKILADSLVGKEDYLRYLYIQKLGEGNNREIIYVPTNGLLPVTEAGRAVQPEQPLAPQPAK